VFQGYAKLTHEVTFEQYDRFCDETGRSKPSDQGWGRGRRPAINVSWFDAAEYCNWPSRKEGLTPFYTVSGTNVSMNWGVNGYRLRTGAEWEYAAKGGRSSRGTEYAGSAIPYLVAWYSSNAGGKTKPVGTKMANEIGLYDMSGNVWEWCNDWYGSYVSYYTRQTDPRGPENGTYRVLRGGSWLFDAVSVNRAVRGVIRPGDRSNVYGFRPVRPAE
jgi:formylglycine-generating enzyme required for sulfatase activity